MISDLFKNIMANYNEVPEEHELAKIISSYLIFHLRLEWYLNSVHKVMGIRIMNFSLNRLR